MLISLNWLKEFVPIDDTPYAIADRLTMAGLEVEQIREIGSEWDKVVVGEILSITRHPNADKLSLTTVKSGANVFSVICGAPNIKEGQKIALALDGACLPNGTLIKKTKIRGQISEGMICSETELGLGNDSSGILVLPTDAPPGMPLADYLGLRDIILDISITPNRSDCLSILGIARELSALYDIPCTIPQIQLCEHGKPAAHQIDITIIAPEDCPRYAARIVRNVTIQPSPLWMQRRLVSCGIRAINNIVDVTNYIMLERGQPLHAFDLSRINGPHIIVRHASPGERFVTLDGVERLLPDGALLICDSLRPVAIAGIMGGLDSGVSPSTQDVLLESAYFNPRSINQTSRRLKLKTEASQRFEKGIDINGVIPSLDRAASLIQQTASGFIATGYVDQYVYQPPPARPIIISVSKANRIAGTQLSQSQMSDMLSKLQFDISSSNEDTLTVVPPSFRYDIHEPIDIVEEISRMSGYNHIPITLPCIEMQCPAPDLKQALSQSARDILQSAGFFEAIHYSFIAPTMISSLRFPDNDLRSRPVTLRNPLSQSQSVLRTTLIPAMLETVCSNFNNGATSLRFFELGKVFMRSSDAKIPREILMLCALVSGQRHPLSYHMPKEQHDLFDIKGALSTLCTRLHIPELRLIPCSPEPYLHPKNSMSIYIEKTMVGSLGQIHPDVSDSFELQHPVYIFELDFDQLSEYARSKIRYVPFSRQPAIYRDIALVVEEGLPVSAIFEAIGSFNNNLITEVTLFDIFRGGAIPPGRKSVAFRLKFQSPDRTLTDAEVNKIHERLISFLSSETGAQLRQ